MFILHANDCLSRHALTMHISHISSYHYTVFVLPSQVTRGANNMKKTQQQGAAIAMCATSAFVVVRR